MATLNDGVRTSYSVKRLSQLTRPDDPEFSTIDDDVLQQACDDITGALDRLGVTFDQTDISLDRAAAQLAIDGVVYLLERRVEPGGSDMQQAWRDWQNDARDLSLLRRRDRITPTVPDTGRTNYLGPSHSRMTTPGRPYGNP